MIGETIHGKYHILEQISQDRLATTFLARDQGRNELVVVRLLHLDPEDRSQFLERFRDEVDRQRDLTSPQILKALDCGEWGERPYVVFEHGEGKNLADVCQAEGRLPLDRALQVASQVGLCLIEAQAHNLVHGDLRPAHILLDGDGLVKILNFGLAWSLDLGRLIAEGRLEQDVYHAPELAANATPDSRSDLYSLGAILFEMVTGQRPDVGKPDQRPIQLLPDLPPELDDLIARCLAREPNKRPQSAAEFLEGIDETVRGLATAPGGVTIGIEEALAGHTLGPYRMVEKLGQGGMATVYKAYEASLDRYVAVKVLPQHFAHDPTFLTRFRREAKAIARLNHPNIVPVYNFGEAGDLAYIAMQYVEGGTLKKLLGQPMPPEQALKLAIQIARALSYAHKRDVIHRDIKPANVLMAEGDWPLLSDFGLARMMGSSVQLTQTGVGIGTPAYMSPEQGQGLPVDGRSDIYSLGIMLYEMLAGRVPFQADTPLAVVLKHLTAPLPMPREINPHIPESVERIILKATAKEAAHRYQTADEMIVAMEQALADLPVKATPGLATVSAAPPAPPPATGELTGVVGPEVSAATEVLAPPRPGRRIPGWVLGLAGGMALAGLIMILLLVMLLRRAAERREMEAELHASPTVAAEVVEGVPETGLTTAETPPAPPISPDQPPLAGLEVKPCSWDNLGPGLCIHSPAGEPPIRILQDSPLEFSAPPTWSPDGRQIVFSALEPGGDPSVDSHIYIVNADGSGLVSLPSMGNDIAPAWSPDGKWLAFHSNCNLGIMHPDGSEQTLLWPSDGRLCVGQPQWSPDSQLIAASMSVLENGKWRFPGTREVWVFLRDGAKFFRVTTIDHPNDQCVREEVAFSPDGKQVAYVDGNCQTWAVKADPASSGQAEPLHEFPIEWTATIHPQWGATELAAKEFFDDFDGKTLDQSLWEPWGDLEGATGRLTDGRLWIKVENKQVGLWDGGLQARLAAPVRQIKFLIGLDEAEGPRVGFGISFADASGRTRRVLLNPAGDILLQDELKIETLRPAKPPPFHYDLRLEWVGEEVQIYVDGELIGATPGLGLGQDVGFFVHLDPGGRLAGYLDQVYMEYGQKEDHPPAPSLPPAAEHVGKVVGQCEDAQPRQICVKDIQTGKVTPLTESLEFEDIGLAAWSPDGGQIVFDAGSSFETSQRHDHKLYLLNADGSGLRQITHDDNTNDMTPAWSPDREWIAFHRNCDLWLVRPDGSDAQRRVAGSDSLCASMMVWSPDSQKIAFLSLHDMARGPRTIHVLPRQEEEPRVVYTFEEPIEWARVAWSPDGERLAVWSQPAAGEQKTFLVNADGSGQMQEIEEMPWSWMPNFWPQWAEGPRVVSLTSDTWGYVVVPAGQPIRLAFVGGLSGEAPELGEVEKNGFLMAIEEQPVVYALQLDALGNVVENTVQTLIEERPLRRGLQPGTINELIEGAVQTLAENEPVVLGFPVEAALIADGGCTDEGKGREAAGLVISTPEIVGVIGHMCSASCQAGANLYEEAHVVMISPSCTAPPLSEPGYEVFNRVAFRDDQGGEERNRQVVNTASYQDFARRYQERFGHKLDDARSEYYAAYAYDATAVLIQAIERVARVDQAGNLVIGRQALVQAVRATRDHPGVTGDIRFDARGDRLP
ncbi:MAG: hypothetical protein Kow0063_38830 [Anaerolineae bacterium]